MDPNFSIFCVNCSYLAVCVCVWGGGGGRSVTAFANVFNLNHFLVTAMDHCLQGDLPGFSENIDPQGTVGCCLRPKGVYF